MLLSSCVTPSGPRPGSSSAPSALNNWTQSEKQTFNNQCNTEMSVLRLDLDQRMILAYCDCAFGQVEERYSFQQLRINTFNDPQIRNIDQICTIEANLPPDPASFGGPSFGGVCDNAGSYEDKLVCLGLPVPVLTVVPWRK